MNGLGGLFGPFSNFLQQSSGNYQSLDSEYVTIPSQPTLVIASNASNYEPVGEINSSQSNAFIASNASNYQTPIEELNSSRLISSNETISLGASSPRLMQVNGSPVIMASPNSPRMPQINIVPGGMILPNSTRLVQNIPDQRSTIRNYELKQELGRGTFGVTYLGYDLKNQRYVAVKTIDVAKSQQLGVNFNSINDEIDTLKQLSANGCSRFIACYYDSFVDTWNNIQTVFIVSEYIEGGSLTNYIRQNQGRLSVGTLWPLILQLILGLKMIHDKGYAHRDIKPDNILITKDLTIKYIDFGLACLERCRISMCTNTCKGAPGTVLYMPPEFFTGARVDSLAASKAHDVWSLTMVLFELSNGSYRYPFQIYAPDATVLPMDVIKQNIANAPQFGSGYTGDDGRTNKFLNSLVVRDWRARPTIDIAFIRFILEVASVVWT